MARFMKNEKIYTSIKRKKMNLVLLPHSSNLHTDGKTGFDSRLNKTTPRIEFNKTVTAVESIPDGRLKTAMPMKKGDKTIIADESKSAPKSSHTASASSQSKLKPKDRNPKSTNHEIPAPFPITREMSIPVPFSDDVKMVFTAIPKKDIVILFSLGLNVSEIKFCTQAGVTTKVFWHASNAKTDHCCVLMFTCRRHAHWKPGEAISVTNGTAAPLPSTAFLHPALTAVPPRAPRYFLCVMAIVRNVARFIPDWVRYHRRVGVDRFFVFDNNSTDLHALPPLPDVELIPWPWKRSQRQAYSYAAALAEPRCAWLAAIDVDEYIFPRAGPSFAAIVRGLDRPGTGGLVLRSMTMTDTDLRRCANDSVPVPERYLYRQPKPRMWEYNPKTLVRPAAARGLHSVHTCATEPAWQAWVPRETAHIVHYKLPCWADYYAVKLKSGRAASAVDIRWDPGEVGPDRPLPWVLDLPRSGGYTVVDTAFRDFKRRLEAAGRPPPPPTILRDRFH
jgi:hypothetical protein